MQSREECIDGFAQAISESDAACAQMTPREQAEAAWSPGCGRTVDEIEASIRARRGLPTGQVAS